MIGLLVKIKHKLPFVWQMAEKVNSALFLLRYNSPEKVAREVTGNFNDENIDCRTASSEDINALIDLYNNQPEGYLSHFKPHAFDSKTISGLLKNRAYALMVMVDKLTGKTVGYFFLRCFFNGKAFHGLMVDHTFTNKGLGTTMWALSMEICNKMGLRMLATVYSGNKSSLNSAARATKMSVLEHLANDYLLIECRPCEI